MKKVVLLAIGVAAYAAVKKFRDRSSDDPFADLEADPPANADSISDAGSAPVDGSGTPLDNATASGDAASAPNPGPAS